jgi:hypothetical protein
LHPEKPAAPHLPPGWIPLSDIELKEETDIDRLRQALGRWAAKNRLEPGEICWIGVRDEAISGNETAAENPHAPGAKP